MTTQLETIDIAILDLVTGGEGDLCTQAMVDHLTGKGASAEGIADCAKKGITLGMTSTKDLPQLPSKKK